MPKTTDPTALMCEAARGFDEVVEGTSCTQTSFKRGKKAFFYVGEQGGRFKAMFKLEASMEDAEQRAGGVLGWFGGHVTAVEREVGEVKVSVDVEGCHVVHDGVM